MDLLGYRFPDLGRRHARRRLVPAQARPGRDAGESRRLSRLPTALEWRRRRPLLAKRRADGNFTFRQDISLLAWRFSEGLITRSRRRGPHATTRSAAVPRFVTYNVRR